MYNLPYAYAYAVSDMRRITLVLMHILIQPPSSYKSSFSYKTSDDAETHDPSTHATDAEAKELNSVHDSDAEKTDITVVPASEVKCVESLN